MSKRLSLSVWVANKGKPVDTYSFVAPDNLSADSAAETILRQAGIKNTGSYTLFIGRTISGDELKNSLAELGAVNGGVLHLMDTPELTHGLSFFLPNVYKPFATLHKVSGVLGRYHSDIAESPDIDVTPLLGKEDDKISRRQAVFNLRNGSWHVGYHPSGHVQMYVDSKRIEEGEEAALRDGATLSFGANLNAPVLALKVRLEVQPLLLYVWTMNADYAMQNAVIDVSEGVAAEQMIEAIFKQASIENGSRYSLFIGRIMRETDLKPEKLNSLAKLSGSAIHLVQVAPDAVQPKLILMLPRHEDALATITESPANLGRYDENNSDALHIDVDSLLGQDKTKISRRQAIFTQRGGYWYVRKHPSGRVPIYIDAKIVNDREEVRLRDGAVLTIGSKPFAPVLTFNIKIQV